MSKLMRPRAFQRTGRVGRWYEVKNLAVDMAEVAIYDEIGGWGVSASEFVQEIQTVTARNIKLRINSPGGDVFDGLAILNALRQHPANVEVVVDGLAASAASFIAMAGDKVSMAPQSMMMIHMAQGLVVGDAVDMREMADLLDKSSQNIAAVYAQKSGVGAEVWLEKMAAETWFTDQEAVDAGLADEVLNPFPKRYSEEEKKRMDEEGDDKDSEDKSKKPATVGALTSDKNMTNNELMDIAELLKEAFA